MFGFNKEKWIELNGINTAKEIYQQPELWLKTLEIVESNKDKIESFIDERLKKEKVRVIFTGAGTSAYVGEVIVPYLNKRKEYIFEAIATTDIVSNPESYLKKHIPTILVSFARSGDSPESVAAYDLANRLVDDISHIFITCNSKGKLAKMSEKNKNTLLLLMPDKSNDLGFAMTSSFTCMTIAASLIFDMENFEENKKQISEMSIIGGNILDEGYKEEKKLLDYDYERIVYLGSSSFFGISKESSLKLLELTRGQIISFNESVLGFRHGPKSIVDDKTLIFLYVSIDDYTRKYDMDMLNEIYNNAGEHKVISITKEYDEEAKKNSNHHLCLSKNPIKIYNEIYISLLYVLYAQVFALLYSVKTNVEPDNPNPKGIVNRVVKGVSIYNYK
ncbi:SIS domain-containing protein [Clostridium butanoliproducens]|uniref:SIS domain-containing protein n=2 Tax=Clostridium faecium TaxID=2762223 RepID=A0ABR8YS87_9CLOT|nr:SIS domain-containing protein [Clostridium butanoliproducens]MBD8046734.1 SIS domain-containing protein [Clostridium faecium]MDU1348249.1 SIS domain-containing protein [Clostridium argentinense]